MWQIFGLSAIFSSSLSEIIDKIAIVKVPKIDPAALTFWRNLAFFLFALIVGFLGIFGPLSIVITIPILILGTLASLHSLFYTYLLNKIEISGYGILSYIANFAYLFIDVFMLKTPFSAIQITGIALLTIGGMLFAFDWELHRFKKQYTKWVFMIAVSDAVFFGFEYYLFKYYSSSMGMSESTFLVSYCIVTMIVLFLFALWKNGKSLFIITAPVRRYIHAISYSKFFDMLNSYLWYEALQSAAVSQVNSLAALEPLMIIALIVIAQQFFKQRVKEDVSKHILLYKIAAVTVICIGGLLLR